MLLTLVLVAPDFYAMDRQLSAEAIYKQGIQLREMAREESDPQKSTLLTHQAAALVRRAAMADYIPALCEYARLCQSMSEDVPDLKEAQKALDQAFHFYQRAADLGNVDACLDFALLCYRGYEKTQEGKERQDLLDRAAEYFERAAKKGNADAQYNLGVIYYEKIDTTVLTEAPFHLKKSHGWFLNASANHYKVDELSLAMSFYKKAENCTDAVLEKQIFQCAKLWLRKAAEKGDFNAYGALGELYQDRSERVDNILLKEKWLNKAEAYWLIAAKNNNAGAAYKLGGHFYKKSTEQPHRKAEWVLQAEQWFLLAAQANHDEAFFSLACLYLKECGQTQDIHIKKDLLTKAEKFLKKFREQEDPRAQNTYAILYTNLSEVTQDQDERKRFLDKAKVCLQKAVESGYAAATYNLGSNALLQMQFDDMHMSKKKVFEKKALQLFKEAEKLGVPQAKEMIADIETKREAQRVCAACHAKNAKQVCGQCMIVHYCSQACQKKQWPEHRKVCKKP